MSETVTLVKSRLSIAEVVGSYIKLEKAGANFRARCPFHTEKTPSFFVSPARNSYYCFGCNRGGDIFSFVQDIEGIDFFESLKMLAARAGVSITFEKPEQKGERARLLSLLSAATIFYEEELQKNKLVLEYLHKRGVTDATIKHFRIGFAPAEWRKTEETLLLKGFSKADIQKTGLSIDGAKKDGTKITYDRFRSRIMFPLFDASGNIVAFSGRIFGEEGDGVAKYVNSPETTLYSKSDLLYGYNFAKQAIRENTFAILVEGQMDLVLSHQAGFINTVAASGTALTERHLALIARMTDTVYLSFDADTAGEKALLRAAGIALPLGLSVRAIHIEGGKDPADVVLSGKDYWKKAIAEAMSIIEYLLLLCERKSTSAEGAFDRARFTKLVYDTVLPLVARIENKIEEGRYVEILSGRLHVPATNILEELKKITSRLQPTTPQEPPPRGDVGIQSRGDILQKQLLGIYFWKKKETTPAIPLSEFLEQLQKAFGEEELKKKIKEAGESEHNHLAMQAELWYKDNSNLLIITQELFLSLEIEQVKEALVKSIDALRAAEEKKEGARIREELARCQTLSERLSELKKVTMNL